MGELRSGSVSLAEIIAYIKQTNQTGRLTIRNTPEQEIPALLAFDQGHLIDARCDGETGDDLVYRLLGTRGGLYNFEHTHDLPPPPARSIARWQERLILAALGILSEEDLTPPPPPPEAIRPAAPPAAPPAAVAAPTAPAPEAPPRPPPPFRNAVPLPAAAPMPLDWAGPGADFTTALERLEEERFAGVLTWAGAAADGRLILYQGQVIEAHWYDRATSAVSSQEEALRQFIMAATGDPAAAQHLTARPLDPNFVWSYSALFEGLDRPHDRNLTGVQWPVLLERAAVRRLTGCLQVTAGDESVYTFLCQGRALGEYEAGPAGLQDAPGRPAVLCALPGSRVDVYTAPERDALVSLNPVAWQLRTTWIAAALGQVALDVLGARGNQVVKLIQSAGQDPQALRAACTRARQVTRIFIGTEEYEELTRRMDQLLAHLRT